MLMVCHHLDREHPRGRRLRREPHPRRDHRGRGHPPRPRRHQHDLQRQPGDGPRRRGDHAHLADRRTRCASSAGRLPSEHGRQRQPAHQPLHRQVHHQPRHRARHRARGRFDRGRASWPISCCGGPRSSARRPELVLKGGFIAWSQMGDANASIPTPQPVCMRPMFGAFGARGGRDLARLRLPARAGGEAASRVARSVSSSSSAVRGCRGPRQAGHEAERRAAAINGRSRDLRGPRRRGVAHLRARPQAAARPALLPLLSASMQRSWRFLQLADAAFPSGGFAHSGGLESALHAGEVSDAAALSRFAAQSLWQAGHVALPFDPRRAHRSRPPRRARRALPTPSSSTTSPIARAAPKAAPCSPPPRAIFPTGRPAATTRGRGAGAAGSTTRRSSAPSSKARPYPGRITALFLFTESSAASSPPRCGWASSAPTRRRSAARAAPLGRRADPLRPLPSTSWRRPPRSSTSSAAPTIALYSRLFQS